MKPFVTTTKSLTQSSPVKTPTRSMNAPTAPTATAESARKAAPPPPHAPVPPLAASVSSVVGSAFDGDGVVGSEVVDTGDLVVTEGLVVAGAGLWEERGKGVEEGEREGAVGEETKPVEEAEGEGVSPPTGAAAGSSTNGEGVSSPTGAATGFSPDGEGVSPPTGAATGSSTDGGGVSSPGAPGDTGVGISPLATGIPKEGEGVSTDSAGVSTEGPGVPCESTGASVYGVKNVQWRRWRQQRGGRTGGVHMIAHAIVIDHSQVSHLHSLGAERYTGVSGCALVTMDDDTSCC